MSGGSCAPIDASDGGVGGARCPATEVAPATAVTAPTAPPEAAAPAGPPEEPLGAWAGPGASPLWPLSPPAALALPPLAAELVIAALSADADAAAPRTLRAACRAARAAVDGRAPRLAAAGAAQAAALGAAAAAGRLPALRRLDFVVERGEPCVAALAAALQHLPALESLTIRERGVGAAYAPTPEWALALAPRVAALTRLRRLAVSLVSSHADCAAALAGAAGALPRLVSLALPWSWAQGAAPALAAGRWAELQELALRGLGDGEFAALAALELPSLAALRLVSCAPGAAGCGALAGAAWFPTLGALSLNDCAVGADEVGALFHGRAAAPPPPQQQQQQQQQQQLAPADDGAWGAGGGGGGGGDDGPFAPPSPPQQQQHQQQQHARPPGAPRLWDLSLRGNRLRDAGAAALAAAALPALSRLSLAGNHVTARGAAALAGAAWAPQLEELDLCANPLIGDAGAAALAAAPLRPARLALARAGLTDAALAALAGAGWARGLRELSLANNRDLGRAAAPWDALAAAPLGGLRRLDLRACCGLGAGAAAALGRAGWAGGVEELLIAGVSLPALSALRRSPAFAGLEARGAVRLRA
ncbi:MAG: hypothetical protein J3K34DRAFT_523766 [Monoraphidium minutum]|nr:MAG: hypothetical protein J3K34DRAFT_523766 [Monoraphidium minutum]